ncbi:hypothetical protein JCM17960_06420 [Magnetospira thiophila]
MFNTLFHHPLSRLLLGALAVWLLCAAFVDPGLMAQARDFNSPPVRQALGMAALLGLPLPWVGLGVLWGLFRRGAVGARVLFVLLVWAATTLMMNLLSIVVGYYQPRAAIEALIGAGATDRAADLPLLSQNAEGLWGLLAAALVVAPASWRSPLLMVGGVTSLLRVFAGEVYLGDAVLAAGIAIMMAALLRRWVPNA